MGIVGREQLEDIAPVASALNDRLASITPRDLAGLTDAIAAVYEAIAGLSEWHLQEVEAVSETRLAEEASRRAATLHEGLSIGLDPAHWLLEAVILLRALESASLEYDRGVELDIDDAYRTSDDHHFVIPRVCDLAPRTGQPFLRRALRRYRVLPTRAASLSVRLYPLSTVHGSHAAEDLRQGKMAKFGAGFFPNLTAKISDGTGDFIVESVSGFNGPNLIDEHLARAVADACHVVAWPELTMPDNHVAHLRTRLTEAALDAGRRPGVYVAGTWHREPGPLNVGHVFDANGLPICSLAKWAKVTIGGRREGIERGTEIPVLVGDDQLITLAICKDFLTTHTSLPYDLLNVDVVVVPSMGDTQGATVAAHRAAADRMRVKYGTRTWVVEQPAAPVSGRVGTVIALPDKPMLEAPIDVQGEWHACESLKPS
jgi:hypothetical protein